MKVDPRLTPNLDSTLETTRVTDQTRPGATRASGPQAISDEVSLSPDVQLANAAVQAASSASDIRPAEVARAKALLNQGQVGNDLDALANKIIDSLLQS